MMQLFKKHWNLIIYLVTTQAWLLGPMLNHHLSPSGAYVSDLFLTSQPWSWLFRVFEVVSGITLFIASYQSIPQHRKESIHHWVLWLIRTLAVCTVIDGLFIDVCSSEATQCHLTGTALFSSTVHGAESIVSVIILLILAVIFSARLPRLKIFGYGLSILLVALLVLQLIDPIYLHIGRGLWQRSFIALSSLPTGLILLL